jgi:hypothetical protein
MAALMRMERNLDKYRTDTMRAYEGPSRDLMVLTVCRYLGSDPSKQLVVSSESLAKILFDCDFADDTKQLLVWAMVILMINI